MAYEKCADVSAELWKDLENRDPKEVAGRTGAVFQEGRYRLPFLAHELLIDPGRRQVQASGIPEADPGFRVCLAAILFLAKMAPAALGPAVSPLELAGGATFFQRHHRLPSSSLEARFGQDQAGFLAAGRLLRGKPQPAGDAALALEVFPGLQVGVIMWQGDEEFPAQVSFTVPAHLDRFWNLDVVWALLNLVVLELLRAAPSHPNRMSHLES